MYTPFLLNNNNNTTATPAPLVITKNAIGLRYSGSNDKLPLQLTLEYGPQRMGEWQRQEATPAVHASSSYTTWQNQAHVYYADLQQHEWSSAYFMASITGAVLEPLLVEAVSYCEERKRYQPFVVYQGDRVVVKSSSSGDFIHHLWTTLAELGVQLRPILPPPVYVPQLHVSDVRKVAAGDVVVVENDDNATTIVSQEASLFYTKLQTCVTAIATGDYSAFQNATTTTMEPTMTPTTTFITTITTTVAPTKAKHSTNNTTKKQTDNTKDIDDGGNHNNNNNNSDAGGEVDENDQHDDDDNQEDNNATATEDHDAAAGDDDDETKDADKDHNVNSEMPPTRLLQSLRQFWCHVRDISSSSTKQPELQNRRRRTNLRMLQRWMQDQDQEEEDQVTDDFTENTSTNSTSPPAPSSAPTKNGNEAEEANKAAQEAKEKAHEAKEAATTEADSKAADAAEAAANAAQKAADVTTQKQQQVLQKNLLSGDGDLMSMSLVTCFTDPQYELVQEDGSAIAYIYLDGATFYRLNLTMPYLDVAKADRPIPQPPSAAGSGGGDFVDWTLAIATIAFLCIGVMLVFQRIGFKFLEPLYKLQKWFFSPTDSGYDSEEEEAMKMGQGFEHAFGEDAIPFSMGGRRPDNNGKSPRQRRQVIPMDDNDDLYMEATNGQDYDEDGHPGHVEMVGDTTQMRLRSLSSSSGGLGSGAQGSDNHHHGRHRSGPIIMDLPGRLSRDPDLVDLPNLSSTSKVAVPVSIENQRSRSRDLTDDDDDDDDDDGNSSVSIASFRWMHVRPWDSNYSNQNRFSIATRVTLEQTSSKMHEQITECLYVQYIH